MATLLKTSIFNNVKSYSDREGLILPGQTIIIGLSGGPDSLFLYHFLISMRQQYRLTLIGVHINHGWRSDACADALFCKRVCETDGIQYIEGRLSDIRQLKHSGSREEKARNARRIFFEACAKEYQADVIALAHHQDDLVETFFIRLIRGAGISGLSSIRPRNGIYIRPLLCITKQDILSYLSLQGIGYCTDSTNGDTSFLRNALRHTLIPVFTALDSRAYKNTVKTIKLLQEADNDITAMACKIYDELRDNEWILIKPLLTLDGILQHRVLMNWLVSVGVHFTPTERFFKEIVRFLSYGSSTSHSMSSTWNIEKRKGRARIIYLPHI